ncbi:Polynucleotide 3'-phosphatase [Trinorchestia longiramus]|nr:Polynucleotide 3'-phosphatase [Trinorchestia longiramus]
MRCVLRSLDPESHCDFTVWDCNPVKIGRSRDTRIKDKRCSKEQVEITCDLHALKCIVTQLGRNSSALNGNILQQRLPLVAEHGDILEVLAGSYKYKIEFDPPHSVHSEERENIKNSSSNIKSKFDNSKSSCVRDTETVSSLIKETDSLPIPQAAEAKKGLLSTKIPQLSSKSHVLPTKDEMPKSKQVKGPASSGKKRTAQATADEEDNPGAKKAKSSGSWKSVEGGDLLVFNGDLPSGSEKVAAYDIDGTLITTQSGRVFATDYHDWKIIYSEVPGKLKEMHQQGYKIVLFTNQGGIGSGKQTAAGIQGKIGRIVDRLGVPVQAFVSTRSSKFRKPLPFMWSYFEDHCNCGMVVQRTQSVYVGDAAGRPEVRKVRKKDHSFVDRLFAINLGVPFHTPEQHFLGKKPDEVVMPAFDPRALSADAPLFTPASTKVPADGSEVVVLVGFPGSGKSVLSEQLHSEHGYHVANRDTLGSWQKCVAVVEKVLKGGGRVVVDNTNPDRSTRARYVKIAGDHAVPVRCFVFNVSKMHAMHNNRFRELTEPSKPKVSEMVYNMYNSKFEKPEKSEGFTEVVTVNFVPKFKDETEEELYRMFLLEK